MWPSPVQELILEDEMNQPTDKVSWAISLLLQHLAFGESVNQSFDLAIDRMVYRASLRQLELENKYPANILRLIGQRRFRAYSSGFH